MMVLLSTSQIIQHAGDDGECWRQHAFALYSFVSWDTIKRVATQEAITAKKSLWSSSSFSPSSTSFFSLPLSVSRFLYVPIPVLLHFYTQRDYYLIILNTCELLSIKYQVLPLESSRLVQVQTNETHTNKELVLCSFFFFFILFSMFEIMRQMFNCRGWIFLLEKVSKWNRNEQKF